jgi:glycosyltransferase involved in cell wall biosynthesis
LCSQEELAGLYAACDFTVIPSLFEGMPNVLLEAMACSVVPIVSDAGAMGNVVEHGKTGFLFRAEDRCAAAEATRAALRLSDEELSIMAGRARTHVTKHFTVDRELDVLYELMDIAFERSRRNTLRPNTQNAFQHDASAASACGRNSVTA